MVDGAAGAETVAAGGAMAGAQEGTEGGAAASGRAALRATLDSAAAHLVALDARRKEVSKY